MSRKRKGWNDLPVRQCRTLHHCCLCDTDITCGELYRDGGLDRRAHINCIADNGKKRRAQQAAKQVDPFDPLHSMVDVLNRAVLSGLPSEQKE